MPSTITVDGAGDDAGDAAALAAAFASVPGNTPPASIMSNTITVDGAGDGAGDASLASAFISGNTPPASGGGSLSGFGLNPFVVGGDVFFSPGGFGTGSPTSGLGNAAAGIPPGAILVTCLFSFPVPMGQLPAANDNQTVTVTVLDAAGQPVLAGGLPQAATSVGVVFYASGLYECRVAVPPGFAGSVLAVMATGANTGQTATQAIDYSRAIDISPLCISAAGPYANLLNPAMLAAEDSDGWLYVKMTAVPNVIVTPAPDMSGNPVEIAVTGGGVSGGNGFIPAEWLTVPSGAAAGGYVRLFLSALAGTALTAGAYRVFVRINGTTILRAPDVLIVQRSRSVSVMPSASGNSPLGQSPPSPLPLTYSQYAVLSYQNAVLTKQLGDIMALIKRVP